jgi:hypothetical protein
MESSMKGTIPGAGAFVCAGCGHTFALSPPFNEPPHCPNCGSSEVSRTTLATTRFERPVEEAADPQARERWLERARALIDRPGEYLAYEEGGEVRVVELAREWTRIGRSLAADIRFDDPTVSRRHALIVRQPDGVRVLDDRSLNGVFVNGERVEWRVLEDGDEIVVGRHRLFYLSAPPTKTGAATATELGGEEELQPV